MDKIRQEYEYKLAQQIEELKGNKALAQWLEQRNKYRLTVIQNYYAYGYEI